MPALLLLSQERRARGLTQAALAKAAGLTIPTVRGLERGTGTIGSLLRVMEVLDLSWDWVPTGETPAASMAKRRKAKGLSQAELARRIECARVTILQMEKEFIGSVSILLAVLSALELKPVLRSGRRSHKGALTPPRNAPERDRVMTPPDLAAAILAHFDAQISGSLLDPAKGQGAFFDQFPTRIEKDWCEIAEGRDFLRWTQPVDWIVTNPPWSHLREFTQHAMTLAPNIVWLAPIVNLTTKARLRDLQSADFGIAELIMIDTPKSWPQSGFQLVAAHLKKGHGGGWKVGRLETKEVKSDVSDWLKATTRRGFPFSVKRLR